MQKLLQTLIDAILPPKDDVRNARGITEEEFQNLLHPTVVRDSWIISLFPYKDARIRSFIRSVKFYADTTTLPKIGSVVGEFLMETVSDKRLLSGWNVPVLVPMPASPKRLRERGYNQVERIALCLLPYLENAISYSPKLLERTERKSQVRVERKSREENIKGAFFVSSPELVRGKQIILLDDVVESGATMYDARRALLEAGAAEALGIAIAH